MLNILLTFIFVLISRFFPSPFFKTIDKIRHRSDIHNLYVWEYSRRPYTEPNFENYRLRSIYTYKELYHLLEIYSRTQSKYEIQKEGDKNPHEGQI